MSATSSLCIEDLDSDVLLHIFSYLDVFERHRCRSVCKIWNKVLKYSIAKQRKLKFCQTLKGLSTGSDTIAIGYFTSLKFIENALKYSPRTKEIEFLYTNGNYLSLEKTSIFQCIAKYCGKLEKFSLKYLTNSFSRNVWSLYGNDVKSLAYNLVNLKIIDIEIRSSVNGNHLIPIAALPYLKSLTIVTFDDSSLTVSDSSFVEHFASTDFQSLNIKYCSNFDHNQVIKLMNSNAKKSLKHFVLNKISFCSFVQLLSEFGSLSHIDLCFNSIEDYECDFSKSFTQLTNLKTLTDIKLNNTSGEVLRFDSILLLMIESNSNLKSIYFYNIWLTDESLSRISEFCQQLISLSIGMSDNSLLLCSETWCSISLLTKLKTLRLKRVTGFSATDIIVLIKNSHLSELDISGSESDQSLRTEIFNEITNLSYDNNFKLKLTIDKESIKI